MLIAKDTIVTLHCRLFGLDGQCLDAGETPLIYLHGDYDGIFPPLEQDLQGRGVGDSVTITLLPEDAYGELEVALIAQVPKSEMPDDVDVGMAFSGGPLPMFEEEPVVYRVVGIDGDTVILDGNHPLAGKTLSVTCVVQHIRAASQEEIAAGHPL